MSKKRFLLTLTVVLMLCGLASCKGQSNSGDIDSRVEALANMSNAKCEKTDAYSYIKPPSPRVQSNGAVFHFDCQEDVGGWFFPGEPEDRWTPRPATDAVIPSGQLSIQLPIEWVRPPVNRHHPAYPQALIWSDLRPGMHACIHEYDGTLEPVTIESAFVEVEITSMGQVGHIAANFSSATKGKSADSLMNLGLLPYVWGMWSDTHLTAGFC